MIGPEDRVSRACADTLASDDPIKSEGRVPNRIVRWTPNGWEVEPDQRHADLIVQEMRMKDAKPVGTPGERADKDSDEASEELEEKQASRFKSVSNYPAADRTDLMYSVKEICRGMAKPEDKEMAQVNRLAR